MTDIDYYFTDRKNLIEFIDNFGKLINRSKRFEKVIEAAKAEDIARYINRNKKNNVSDLYPTPQYCLKEFIKKYHVGNNVLEPTAGIGSILYYLLTNRREKIYYGADLYKPINITAVEFMLDNVNFLKYHFKHINVIQNDFLTMDFTGHDFDTIICNPPFTKSDYDFKNSKNKYDSQFYYNFLFKCLEILITSYDMGAYQNVLTFICPQLYNTPTDKKREMQDGDTIEFDYKKLRGFSKNKQLEILKNSMFKFNDFDNYFNFICAHITSQSFIYNGQCEFQTTKTKVYFYTFAKGVQNMTKESQQPQMLYDEWKLLMEEEEEEPENKVQEIKVQEIKENKENKETPDNINNMSLAEKHKNFFTFNNKFIDPATAPQNIKKYLDSILYHLKDYYDKITTINELCKTIKLKDVDNKTVNLFTYLNNNGLFDSFYNNTPNTLFKLENMRTIDSKMSLTDLDSTLKFSILQNKIKTIQQNYLNAYLELNIPTEKKIADSILARTMMIRKTRSDEIKKEKKERENKYNATEEIKTTSKYNKIEDDSLTAHINKLHKTKEKKKEPEKKEQEIKVQKKPEKKERKLTEKQRLKKEEDEERNKKEKEYKDKYDPMYKFFKSVNHSDQFYQAVNIYYKASRAGILNQLDDKSLINALIKRDISPEQLESEYIKILQQELKLNIERVEKYKDTKSENTKSHIKSEISSITDQLKMLGAYIEPEIKKPEKKERKLSPSRRQQQHDEHFIQTPKPEKKPKKLTEKRRLKQEKQLKTLRTILKKKKKLKKNEQLEALGVVVPKKEIKESKVQEIEENDAENKVQEIKRARDERIKKQKLKDKRKQKKVDAIDVKRKPKDAFVNRSDLNYIEEEVESPIEIPNRKYLESFYKNFSLKNKKTRDMMRDLLTRIPQGQDILDIIYSENVGDLYPTPQVCLRDYINDNDIYGKTILEPSAGLGSIIYNLFDRDLHQDPIKKITAYEIDISMSKFLINQYPTVDVIRANFLTTKTINNNFDLIICNPPFTHYYEDSKGKSKYDKSYFINFYFKCCDYMYKSVNTEREKILYFICPLNFFNEFWGVKKYTRDLDKDGGYTIRQSFPADFEKINNMTKERIEQIKEQSDVYKEFENFEEYYETIKPSQSELLPYNCTFQTTGTKVFFYKFIFY